MKEQEKITKVYEIGGKKFYQKELGLQQTKSLVREMQGVQLQRVDAMGLFQALGDKAALILSMILIPVDVTPLEFVQILKRPTGLDETVELLEAELAPRQVLEVLADFLVCNHSSLVLDLIIQAMAQGSLLFQKMLSQKEFAPSPQEATQPDAMPS